MYIRNICIVYVLAMACTSSAFAGLGEAPTAGSATIQAGGGSARSIERRTAPATYTVNEIQTSGGGTIREYVSASGIVFGISWSSPSMPNLRELLGAYFPSFEQAAVASRAAGRRGPISVDSDDLVLESGGRMRDYRGRAYVPALLPANTDGTVVQ